MQNVSRGLFPGLGLFSPQQYGNINNEKNIRDRNNSLVQEISGDKLHIASLEKENAELKKEAKKVRGGVEGLEKEKREKEKQLEEAKRVGSKTDQLEQDIKRLDERIKEVQTENHIIELKEKKSRYQNNLDNEMERNREKRRTMEENNLYHEIVKIKKETDKLVAENKGLQESINSPEFTNPNEAYQEAYKERAKELYRNELFNKQLEYQKQNNDLKIRKMSVLNPGEIDRINKEHEAAKQKQLAENAVLQQEVEQLEAPIKEYNAKTEILDRLRKEGMNLVAERDKAAAHAKQLRATITYGDNREKNKTKKEKMIVIENGKEVEKEMELPVAPLDTQIAKEAEQVGRLIGANKKYQEKIDRSEEILKNKVD